MLRKTHIAIVILAGTAAPTLFTVSAQIRKDRDPAASASFEKVWSSDRVEAVGATISSDGRRFLFSEASRGRLVLHDLVTGLNRFVTEDPPGFLDTTGFAIAADGKTIAYNWSRGQRNGFNLRVANMEESGLPRFRQLLDDPQWRFVYPKAWSPDQKSIVALFQNNTQASAIGVVSAETGEVRILKSLTAQAPAVVVFSPDERLIAFDQLVPSPKPNLDVVVLSADGNREIVAIEHPSTDIPMAWSVDGRNLLFASDRSGTMAVWSVPWPPRKTNASPVLIAEKTPGVRALGMSKTGTLYVTNVEQTTSINLASVDFDTGKELASEVRVPVRSTGTVAWPVWSRDGKKLAYIWNPPTFTDPVIVIYSLDKGEERELRPPLGYMQSMSWTSDGQTFAIAGADGTGRQGLFRYEVVTGQLVPWFFTAANDAQVRYNPQWSADGSQLYFRRSTANGRIFFALDVASGTEREVARGYFGGISLSPDGQWIATSDQGASTASSAVLLISIRTGAVRELLRVNAPAVFSAVPMAWTPDGQNVVVTKAGGGGPTELLVVPIQGGPARRLSVDASELTFNPVAIHPDGQRLMMVLGKPIHEIWKLETAKIMSK